MSGASDWEKIAALSPAHPWPFAATRDGSKTRANPSPLYVVFDIPLTPPIRPLDTGRGQSVKCIGAARRDRAAGPHPTGSYFFDTAGCAAPEGFGSGFASGLAGPAPPDAPL